MTENAGSVWTVGLSGEKKIFVFKFTRISVDGALEYKYISIWKVLASTQSDYFTVSISHFVNLPYRNQARKPCDFHCVIAVSAGCTIPVIWDISCAFISSLSFFLRSFFRLPLFFSSENTVEKIEKISISNAHQTQKKRKSRSCHHFHLPFSGKRPQNLRFISSSTAGWVKNWRKWRNLIYYIGYFSSVNGKQMSAFTNKTFTCFNITISHNHYCIGLRIVRSGFEHILGDPGAVSSGKGKKFGIEKLERMKGAPGEGVLPGQFQTALWILPLIRQKGSLYSLCSILPNRRPADLQPISCVLIKCQPSYFLDHGWHKPKI